MSFRIIYREYKVIDQEKISKDCTLCENFDIINLYIIVETFFCNTFVVIRENKETWSRGSISNRWEYLL